MITREEWLGMVLDQLRPKFLTAGFPLPDTIRASVGFPSAKGLALKNRVIGECWHGTDTVDGRPALFVSPLVDTGIRAADVLVHEGCHAAVGPGHGHRGPFRRAAMALGLTGKMTATLAGPQLEHDLQAILAGIGDYPHAAITPKPKESRKQSTRMLKLYCPLCGYTARTSSKWIEVGLPTCPCGAIWAADDIEEK